MKQLKKKLTEGWILEGIEHNFPYGIAAQQQYLTTWSCISLRMIKINHLSNKNNQNSRFGSREPITKYIRELNTLANMGNIWYLLKGPWYLTRNPKLNNIDNKQMLMEM